MRKLATILTAALALGSSAALASVSLKNGNFFVGYTDIVYPGGFEPKIERVYNSKTPYKGMFGWGWGNEYEVYLTVSADGSVVVHEYGGGAENRFNPLSFSQSELDKAVDSIAAVAQKAGVLGSQGQMASYKTRLKTDAMFRNDEWEKFRAQGKIQPRQLAVGTQLQSNRFSYQYITRAQGGYIRTYDNGKSERFNDLGRLARVTDKNNNFIDFTYNKENKLEKLVDNFNRKMFFGYGSNGMVEKIEGENDKKAHFDYNSLGELTQSKDVDGNTYTFKYDTAKRHNLTEIGYSDNTKMAIGYYGRDKQENVQSVKDRDGTMTQYTYDRVASDRSHYAVAVRVSNSQGQAISSSKYEYTIKTKPTGEEWTYRLVTTLDGDKTETTYNECCGLPLLIKHASDETAFEYDVKGRVTKKSTPNEVTILDYDQKAGKVAKVRRFPKANSKQVAWSEFQYDGSANLVFARNSEGKGVRLFYDNNGRIKSLVDNQKRQINFKYNENSKPVEISDPAVGSIHVSYTNSGEIKKVESSAGRKIALQVTTAFQNLLEIIRPAGVTLSL